MHRENVCQHPFGGSVPPVSRSLVSPSVVSVLMDAASARSFQPEARLATLTGLEVNSNHQKWVRSVQNHKYLESLLETALFVALEVLETELPGFSGSSSSPSCLSPPATADPLS